MYPYTHVHPQEHIHMPQINKTSQSYFFVKDFWRNDCWCLCVLGCQSWGVVCFVLSWYLHALAGTQVSCIWWFLGLTPIPDRCLSTHSLMSFHTAGRRTGNMCDMWQSKTWMTDWKLFHDGSGMPFWKNLLVLCVLWSCDISVNSHWVGESQNLTTAPCEHSTGLP